MSKVYKMIVDDKPVFNVDMIREDKLTEQLLNDFDRYVDLCNRIDRKLKIISKKWRLFPERLTQLWMIMIQLLLPVKVIQDVLSMIH